MVRILILYASLGSGHVSAAEALCNAFTQVPSVEVWCEDALAHASPIYRRVVTQAYEQLSEKAPQLYKAFYEGSHINDLEKSLDNNLTWAKLERPFFRKLAALVRESDPDAVVCVQQIPSRLLQLLDPEEQLSKPQYVVITDVIAHSTWINYGVNAYFVPNPLSANVLIQRGVDPSILHVTGIPVNPEVMVPKSKAEVRSRYDLPLDTPVVTLFGGGLNPKRVRWIVSELLESSTPMTLVVAAGRNEDLLEILGDLSASDQVQLRKLGLINYVDDLVVASDLIITKAGGLITSEILARGTPMILIDPIPGQEEQNADIIAAAGAGVQLRLTETVAPTVFFLLSHPARLAEMHRWSLELGQPRAAFKIAELILQDLQTDQLMPERSRCESQPLPGVATSYAN